MRFFDIAVSAIVGGAVGFAASHFAANSGRGGIDYQAFAEARIDARIESRLARLGLEGPDALDSRISGGVAQFLADQPEAVYGALEQYQINEQAREEEARRQALADLSGVLTGNAEDPSFGAEAAAADVTLVEFFDYRCGYCKRSLETVLALAADDPKLRIVLKEFPILGPESVAATRVSLAANRVAPDRYKDFHMALLRHQGGYDLQSLLAVAAAAGYDPVAVEAAMADDAIGRQIRSGYQIAETLGIRGTPAFVIGDRVIPGAVGVDALKAAIAAAREAEKG